MLPSSRLPLLAPLAFLLLTIAPAPATAAATPAEERLLRAVENPDSAAWAAGELRRMLAQGEVDSAEVGIARTWLTYALIHSGAPLPQVLASADSALGLLGHDPGDRAQIHQAVAAHLEESGDPAAAEARYRTALLAASERRQHAYVRARLHGEIARLELARGAAAPAIASLDSALADLPADNIHLRQRLRTRLGAAHERTGDDENAIEAYLASASVFLGADSSALAPLRALWEKRHGSLAGLDEMLDERRDASRRLVAFEARKFERPAPRWRLKDLAGKPVSLAALKGKVVVLDFWGSWCAPCRLELPHLQTLYERWRDRGVAFVTVNWENAATAAEHRAAATAFMKENGYSFPVVVDYEGVVVEAHGVEGYPTAFVIDRKGRIRFRNLGYTDGIEHILEAQIEELLAGR